MDGAWRQASLGISISTVRFAADLNDLQLRRVVLGRRIPDRRRPALRGGRGPGLGPVSATKMGLRYSWLALLGSLACDSGRARSVVAAPASAPPVAASPLVAAPAKAAAVAAPAIDPRTSGPPGRRFEQSEAWTGGQVVWLGGSHQAWPAAKACWSIL